MRHQRSVTLALALVSMSAVGEEAIESVECQLPASFFSALSESEREAVESRATASADPALREFQWQESRRKIDVPRPKTFHPIPWDQARRMILRGYVSEVSQGHDLTVRLITTRGTGFVSAETFIDEVLIAASAVDPCHLHIRQITE